MRKKNAFTLSEIVITLAVIGVLAAVSLPILTSVRPNQEMAMLKKAYHNTARVVSELINDEELYPDRDGSQCPESYGEGEGVVCDGFANTSIKDMLDGVTEAQYNGHTYSGLTKFCELFAAKMNVDNRGTSCADFTTADGMKWSVPSTSFSGDSKPIIVVDVTGSSKGNNCAIDTISAVGLKTAMVTCGPDKAPDTFGFRVGRHGELEIIGDLAPQYIASDKPTKRYKDFKTGCTGALADCESEVPLSGPTGPDPTPVKKD